MPTTPRAQIDEGFQQYLVGMAQSMEDDASALRSGSTRRPSPRPKSDDWEGADPLDRAHAGAPFVRDRIDSVYAAGVADKAKPSPRGELNALKLENDALASAERDFRRNDRSIVRAYIHAAARRRAHGRADGILRGGISRYVEDLLRGSRDKGAASS